MRRPFILLVEDNPDDERLTLRALKKAVPEVEVDVEHDGESALKRLVPDTGEPRPHLILLDIKLPKLSGLELLRHLRENEHTKSIPVVILTSSEEQSDVKYAYDHGANGYVRKPVEEAEFLQKIGYLGLYWMGPNRQPATE